MKFKRCITLVLLLFIIVCFFPVSNSFGEQGNNAGNKETIRFLVDYADYYDSYQNLNIADKYKNFRPNVDLVVDYGAYPLNNDVFSKYDVIFFPAFENTISDNIGYLAVLNGLQAVKDNIFAKDTAINGNIYGIPATSAFEVVWYRKSIFEEYKLTVPKTWDEFLKCACKIRDGRKYVPIAMASQDHWSVLMLTRSLSCLENGSGALWNEILKQKDPFSKTKPIYNALAKYKSLVDNKLLSLGSVLSTSDESLNLFTEKKAAMLCWKEYLKEHSEFRDPDIGCFFLPTRANSSDKLNIPVNIDSYIMVSNKSKNRGEAFNFVEWLFKEEQYKPLISRRGYTSLQRGIKTDYFPVTKEALELAGQNINLVTPSLASSDFYKRLGNSRIDFQQIGNDILAGRNLDDLIKNLNRQWNSAQIAGPQIPAQPGDAGQYAAGLKSSEVYSRPQIDYSYQGCDISSTKDVSSSINNSVILNADYPYAYAFSVKTRIDSSKYDLKPLMINGYMMVPVNFLHDAFGAAVNTSDSTKITIDVGQKKSVLCLNKNEMSVGTKKQKLPVAPQLINGRIYVPLSGLIENILNMKIASDGKTAIIYSTDSAPLDSEVKEYFKRAELIFKNNSLLRITIDPRIELLKIMEILSQTGGERVTRYGSDYRMEVEKYFLPYINHPSIKFFKEGRPGSDSALLTIMTYLSPPPSLAKQASLTDAIKINRMDEAYVEKYLDAMKKFAADTNFMNFYSKNYKIYRAITQNIEDNANEDKYTDKLTAYYGSELQSYNMILAPLLAMVSVGPHVEWDKGKEDTYSIVSSLQPQNGIPAFGTEERLRGIVWHEFGHSYVNSLVDGRWNELSGYSSLVRNAKMPQNYGGDWKICVNEHIVRAVTARLILRESGMQAYDYEIQSQKSQGFVYIEDICKRLEEYENNRSKYAKFSDFYPRIVDVFKTNYKNQASTVGLSENISTLIDMKWLIWSFIGVSAELSPMPLRI